MAVPRPSYTIPDITIRNADIRDANMYAQVTSDRNAYMRYDHDRYEDPRRMFMQVLDMQENMHREASRSYSREVMELRTEIEELNSQLGGVREENEELKMMLEKIMNKLGIDND